MSGSILTYDDTAFRALLPYFANTAVYPQAAMQGYFNNASDIISTYNYGYLNGTRRQDALYYLTGHFARLNELINANGGNATGNVTVGKVDKVSVTMAAPIAGTAFQQWLGLTPFGQMLRALLAVAGAGGWSTGGNLERQAFRRVYGGFGGRRW